MKNLIIGVDLGGTKISTAISNSKGKILYIETVPTEASMGIKHVIDRIIDSINRVCIKSGNHLKDVRRVGIGAPGPVLSEKGLVINPPNLKGWKRVALRDIVSKRLKKEVVLENDANCAALAELKFGAGKRYNTFIYVTVSTGIGGGIVIDKKLYKGSSNCAGEVGHMVIDMNGPVCPCGRKGHFEGMAAGVAIAKRSGMKPEKLLALALKGNKKALKEIEYTGRIIGVGFANIANILNPEAIIVGGGITNFGRLLFKPIIKTVKKEVLTGVKVKIIPSKLKKDVGVMGALALCL